MHRTNKDKVITRSDRKSRVIEKGTKRPLNPLSCNRVMAPEDGIMPRSMQLICWFDYKTTSDVQPSVIEWFNNYLKARGNMVCNPAIVVDLDDSLFLGSVPHRQKPNHLVKTIIELAINNHYYVVFITARPSRMSLDDDHSNRKMTVDQIENLGYSKMYHRLIMSSIVSDQSGNKIDFAVEKKENRDRLRREGRSIVINIGDQWTDHFAKPDWNLLESEEVAKYTNTKVLIFENDLEIPERTLCVKLPESSNFSI